ncbi:S41 family peptidase [Corynebacterium callunae]|uniref:S41 family peptidase n=1 Tax=Corynebacterium callunae TaxID=1721 RepID=UPI00398226A7
MNKVRMVQLGILATVGFAGFSLVWVFGPVYGAMIFGRPIYLLPPSPQRYAESVFEIAERQGLYVATPEFATARAKAETELEYVDTVADTYPIIDAVLKTAGGKHSALIVPGRISPERQSAPLPEVTTQEGIATLTLPPTDQQWDGQEYANAAAEPLVKSIQGGACGVIVDLRENTGGDLGPMLAGVSALLPDGEVLWFSSSGGDSPVTIKGNAVSGGGTPTKASAQGKFRVPTALLIDEKTASSGEATLLSFRGLDQSKTFGLPTAGFATANMTFEMPDGARVMLTVAQNKTRTGETFGEDPIVPDQLTAFPERAAREWLRTQGCDIHA